MVKLLFGKERFLKDEAVAELRSRLFKNPSELDLNFQSFDASEHSPSAVLDFLSTAPFLADCRMAVVRHIDEMDEEEAERLAFGTKNLPGSACLVLDTEETNVKKNDAVRVLAEKVETVACHTPFERDLPAWVEVRSKKKGFALERGVALFIASRVGADLAALDGALDSLRLYVHPRTGVSLADVEAVTPSNPDEDVFKLADLLLDRKKKEALGVLDGLYRSGVKTPEIVGALAGQIERYKKASAMLSTGRAPEQVGEEMRVPRPFQAAFFQRLRNTPAARLAALQKALLECDESFKTGLAAERVSFERFILKT